jgi:hypothetical protein
MAGSKLFSLSILLFAMIGAYSNSYGQASKHVISLTYKSIGGHSYWPWGTPSFESRKFLDSNVKIYIYGSPGDKVNIYNKNKVYFYRPFMRDEDSVQLSDLAIDTIIPQTGFLYIRMKEIYFIANGIHDGNYVNYIFV